MPDRDLSSAACLQIIAGTDLEIAHLQQYLPVLLQLPQTLFEGSLLRRIECKCVLRLRMHIRDFWQPSRACTRCLWHGRLRQDGSLAHLSPSSSFFAFGPLCSLAIVVISLGFFGLRQCSPPCVLAPSQRDGDHGVQMTMTVPKAGLLGGSRPHKDPLADQVEHHEAALAQRTAGLRDRDGHP
jgi:hypothetical protein